MFATMFAMKNYLIVPWLVIWTTLNAFTTAWEPKRHVSRVSASYWRCLIWYGPFNMDHIVWLIPYESYRMIHTIIAIYYADCHSQHFLGCPCNVECPNGCDGCSNSICQCSVSTLSVNGRDLRHLNPCNKALTSLIQDVEENFNWNKCLDQNGMTLGRCIYSCEDNSECEAACVEQFKTRTEDCPCEVSGFF